MGVAVTLAILGLAIYTNADPIHLTQFKNIGSADGKTYFLELNNTMSWDAAAIYCPHFGYEFATIETLAQSQLIYSALVAEFSTNPGVWINALEENTYIPLKWRTNGSNLTAGIFPGGIVQTLYEGEDCAFVYKGLGGLRVSHFVCTDASHFLLCQL